MRRAFADLALGARLAATGGADSRLRAALTALGVAFGVALLLFAASVPEHGECPQRARGCPDARSPLVVTPG